MCCRSSWGCTIKTHHKNHNTGRYLCQCHLSPVYITPATRQLITLTCTGVKLLFLQLPHPQRANSSTFFPHLLQPGGLLDVDLQLLPEPLVLPHQHITLRRVTSGGCGDAVVSHLGLWKHRPAEGGDTSNYHMTETWSWSFGRIISDTWSKSPPCSVHLWCDYLWCWE